MLQVVETPLEALRPYPKNAKKHPLKHVEKVAASIREFGFNQPIVADKDGVIIVGHGRYEAAKFLELPTAPVLTVELSEEKAKAYRLADNKLNESEWDMDLVIEELKGLSAEMLDLTGFDADLILPEVEEEEIPDVTDEPKAKLGDIFQLGEHRLVCGDSTKREDMGRLMNGERANMVFTDPPYNIAYEGGMNAQGQNKREGILNDKMSPADFLTFLFKVCANLVEFCDGGIYICMSSSEIPNLRDAFAKGGGHYQSLIVWVKNTFTLSRCDWQNQHEPILYGWPARVKNHYFAGFRDQGNTWANLEVLKPIIEDGKTIIKIGDVHLELEGIVQGRICDKRGQTDIWREKKPSKSPEHPTMKPVALVAKAITASSQRGEIVMDLFGGAGSTLIACENTGRKCFTMEIDPHYVDVTIARWEKLTSRTAEKVAS